QARKWSLLILFGNGSFKNYLRGVLFDIVMRRIDGQAGGIGLGPVEKIEFRYIAIIVCREHVCAGIVFCIGHIADGNGIYADNTAFVLLVSNEGYFFKTTGQIGNGWLVVRFPTSIS